MTGLRPSQSLRCQAGRGFYMDENFVWARLRIRKILEAR
jgi:hypothetical protein